MSGAENGRSAERLVRILLVEDNPADVGLVQEAWGENDFTTRLSVVRNGEEALAFLHRTGPYVEEARPDLLVVDLNLPRKDGRELLAEIKQDPELRRLPVVVLTTSNADVDILKCYDLHANCYVIKPVGLERLFGVLRSIREFWFEVASLPPG